jgi:hypothetical protein
MATIPDSAPSGSSRFQKIVDAFLAPAGLPFAGVLSAERIERIFAQHGNLFGGGAIYSTALMVWSFLGQVLRDGKKASCQAAVARVVTYCHQQRMAAPTADYCKARAKLSEAALWDLAREVAAAVEQQADAKWLWKGRHAKLGDGLPIARAAAILSLATASVMDLAVGPYAGKETGETALLRELLGAFVCGDVAVVDRFYCSFMMIALLLGRNVQVCARMHQRRHVDFRRERRLGKCDRLIVWTKPPRPAWMGQATYDAIPEALEMREIS